MPPRSRCCRPRQRSSSCTRSRSSTTTCRRSTTTTSAAAARPRTSRSARPPRCSPATRSSPRRSGSRCPIRRRWSAGSSRRRRSAMIGGQYRDVTGDTDDLAALHRLKTGALFSASVGVALWVAEVPESAAAGLAGVRRRARAAVPDRRRPARRGRLRGRARGGGGTPTCRRGGRARAGAARRDRCGHVRARGDRRLARRPHGVVRPPATSWRRSASRPSPSGSPAAWRPPGGAATSS